MPHIPHDPSTLQILWFMLKLYGLGFMIVAPLFILVGGFMCLVTPSIRKKFVEAYHEFRTYGFKGNMNMNKQFVSGSCQGEKCFCGKPAEHKVEEVLFHDDPTAWHEVELTAQSGFTPAHMTRVPTRHPFTTYICHEHFVQIMGPAAKVST